MRIIVSGSRTWSDRDTIYRALNGVCEEFDLNYPPDEYGNTMPDASKIVVVHGACPTGADFIADEWCIGNFFTAERHPAEWERLGRAAGMIRNREMADLGADLLLAFPAGRSPGTRGMIREAERRGIPVRVTEGVG